ncbi:MAG: iron-containing alcohol dehydrogenase [Candidatus Bathyarchaeia archaeon]
MLELSFPRIIVIGEGSLEYLSRIRGKRALIVTGSIIKKIGLVDKAAKYLEKNGIRVEAFEVEPEPSVETIIKGAELARKYSPNWIIGLGGGSNLDAAKAIWVLYERSDLELASITPSITLGLRAKAQLLCIPTTSGTGSEASWATIITDLKEKRKMELVNKELVPDIAIVDPELSMTMPQKLVAETGLDALTHAIEAYVSSLRNDFSDALAIYAIQIIFKYLLRSYKNPEDKEAKKKLHYAATMAGLSFSNSQLGMAHALGGAIGGVFRIPHGQAMALLLPYSIEYNKIAARERYEDIAKAANIKVTANSDMVDELVKTLRELNHQLKEPASLKDIGISSKHFEKNIDFLVDRAMRSAALQGNPRVLDTEGARKMFTYIYEGKKVDF